MPGQSVLRQSSLVAIWMVLMGCGSNHPNGTRGGEELGAGEIESTKQALVTSYCQVIGPTDFCDDFEDHNANINPTWTLREQSASSDFSVIADGGNYVYRQGNTSTSNYRRISTSGEGWQDLTVEGKLKVLSFNGALLNWAGLYARYNSSSQTSYIFSIRGDGKAYINKKTGGGDSGSCMKAIWPNTSCGQVVNPPIVANTWYNLKFVLNGNTLVGYVNGAKVIEVVDNNQPFLEVGAIGVGSTGGAKFVADDITVNAAVVVPKVEGKVTLGNKTFAVFSYNNTGSKNVYLPYGPQNSLLTPSGQIQNPNPRPPAWFKPGIKNGALVYPYVGSYVRWSLGGRSAEANAGSNVLPLVDRAQGKGVVIDDTFVPVEYDLSSNFLESVVSTDYVTTAEGKQTVGTTPVSIEATADGAGIASIPIWVSPAIMQPNVYLQYNSRNERGLAGLGWDVGGLSTITRCSKNLARDEKVAEIKFDASDALCLDGELLVLKSGGGGENSVYRTERDIFAKIVRHNQPVPEGGDPTQSEPSYFDVYMKDGRIITYGEENGRLSGFRTKSVFPNPDNDLTDTDSVGPEVTFSWAIRRIKDRFENTITFNYASPGGGAPDRSLDWNCQEKHISSISYSGREVKFNYSYEVDERFFISGFCIRSSARLSSVEIHGPRPEKDSSGSPLLLRKYVLGHVPSNLPDNKMLLKSVMECDSDGVCKPPIKLSYDELDQSYTETENTNLPNYNLVELKVADVNGDGRDDVVYNEWLNDRRVIYYQLSVGGMDGAGKVFSDPVMVDCNDGYFSLKVMNVIDFNMDGLSDFFVLRKKKGILSNGEEYWLDHSNVMLITEKSVDNTITFRQINIDPESLEPNTSVAMPAFADLNGDSLPEIIRIKKTDIGGVPSYSLTYASFDWNTNKVGALTEHCTKFRLDPSFFRTVRVAQLTGVGNSQVPIRGCDEESHFSFFDSNGLASNRLPNVEESDFGEGQKVLYLDVNGDGLMDIIRTTSLRLNLDWNQRWVQGPDVFLNTGNGFHGIFNSTINKIRNVNIAITPLNYYKNGRAAVLILFKDGSPTNALGFEPGRIYVTNGKGEFTSSFRLTSVSRPGTENPEEAFIKPFVVLDAFGEGKDDLLGIASSGKTSLYHRKGSPKTLLTMVEDGLGQKTAVQYSSISQASTPSTGSCVYPIYCSKRGPWVVKSIVRDLQTTYPSGFRPLKDIYSYSGFRQDLRGRGWLGVDARTVSRFNTDGPMDIQPYTATTTSYDNTTIYGSTEIFDVSKRYDYPFKGLAHSVFTSFFNNSLSENDRYIAKYSQYEVINGDLQLGNTYAVKPVAFMEEISDSSVGVPLDMVISTKTCGWDSNTDLIKYDAFGNQIYSRVVETGRDNKTNETITESTYTQNETAWLVSLPKTKSITSWTDDPENIGQRISAKRSWEYFPNQSNGFMSKVIYQPGIPDEELETTIEPNTLGQAEKITKKILTGETRIQRIGYDPLYSAFPESFTNALGQTTKQKYHPGFGTIAYVEDENQNFKSYSYDGFGRIREHLGKDGSGQKISYLQPSSGVGVYSQKITSNGGGESVFTYDRLNREIMRQTKVFSEEGGPYSTSITEYDVNQPNLPSSITEPSHLTIDDATPRASFYYDSLGQVVYVSYPNGYKRSYSYIAGDVQWNNEAGRGQVSRVNAQGNVIEMIERTEVSEGNPSGNIKTNYEYGPFGTLRKIVKLDKIVTKIFYDSSGRKTKLLDPDTGRAEFKYNGFGELREVIDGNGNVGTFKYDLNGRRSEIASKDGVTKFIWDTEKNGIGKLGRLVSPDKINETFGYDEFGRASQRTWQLSTGDAALDGTYSFGFGYDEYGRPKTVTYPKINEDHLSVTNSYTPNGHFKSVAAKGLDWLPSETWIYKINSRDDGGRILSESNNFMGAETTYGYYAGTGLPREIKSVLPINGTRVLSYEYNDENELVKRTVDGQEERFKHDKLGRLIHWEIGNDQKNNGFVFQYDDLGNLKSRGKSQFSNHIPGPVENDITFVPGSRTVYGGSGVGPHQIESSSSGNFMYDSRGDQIAAPTRVTEYTSFGLPKKLVANDETTSFSYGGMQDRVIKKNGQKITLTLGGLFERQIENGQINNIFYVFGDGKVVGQFTSGKLIETSPAERLLFFHYDHLGTVEAITSIGGEFTGRNRFDPFGNRIGLRAPSVSYGYAGLEHDDGIGLINMNGRVYDPAQYRFVTADPIVSNIFSSQDHNPYSYVQNNPLNLIDPSGFYSVDPQGGPDGGPIINLDPIVINAGGGQGGQEGGGSIEWYSGGNEGMTGSYGMSMGSSFSGNPTLQASDVSGSVQMSIANSNAVSKAAIMDSNREALRAGLRNEWLNEMSGDFKTGLANLTPGLAFSQIAQQCWANGNYSMWALNNLGSSAEIGIAILSLGSTAVISGVSKGVFGLKVVAMGTRGAAGEAFHYTFSKVLQSIGRQGLRAGSYITPNGALSPLQAQIELALSPNRGLPDALLRVDLAGLRKAGYHIPEVTQVGRSFGMPGGGFEMQFPYSIPPEFITVVRP